MERSRFMPCITKDEFKHIHKLEKIKRQLDEMYNKTAILLRENWTSNKDAFKYNKGYLDALKDIKKLL